MGKPRSPLAPRQQRTVTLRGSHATAKPSMPPSKEQALSLTLSLSLSLRTRASRQSWAVEPTAPGIPIPCRHPLKPQSHTQRQARRMVHSLVGGRGKSGIEVQELLGLSWRVWVCVCVCVCGLLVTQLLAYIELRGCGGRQPAK